MEIQNYLSEALMGIKSRMEKSDTLDDIASLRGKIKKLSGAALIGLAAVGCSGDDNESTSGQAELASNTQPVLSNIITGFNAGNCQTVTVSAAYREPIIVVITDLADPDNSVSMGLSGEVDNVTRQLSSDSSMLNAPINGYAKLDVYKQSDSTPVAFCHEKQTEDCIRGGQQAYCTVVE